MTLRIGSLCTGYGGLDMAVQAVLDAEVAWVADPDPGAAAILAHHHPDTSNHGDITTTDWAAVEPVDILTAGFPCQPISAAGHGRGIHDDRWLFDDITQAIGRMVTRPRMLLLENVPRLLTLGGGHAMACVVHGLARLGYVGRYRVLSAADIGAPHLRKRIFILAVADTQGVAQREPADETLAVTEGGHARPQPCRGGVHADAHPVGTRPQGACRTPEWVTTAAERGTVAVADPDRHGREIVVRVKPEVGAWQDVDRRSSVRWGGYGPAVERWESITGRTAPDPAETAPQGGRRIAARFMEWMQGLPDGHVTNVPGLSYPQQIIALGNGVVPQQGEAALRMLLVDAGRTT